MKPDFSDPASVVKAFIHTMYCWESLAGTLRTSAQARFNPTNSSSMHPEEFKASTLLRQIPPLVVAMYLTERKRAYVPSGSYSMPPEYDPAAEKIIKCVNKTKSQVLVETDRQTSFGAGPREYVVKKQGNLWLIDCVSQVIGGKKMKVTLV